MRFPQRHVNFSLTESKQHCLNAAADCDKLCTERREAEWDGGDKHGRLEGGGKERQWRRLGENEPSAVRDERSAQGSSHCTQEKAKTIFVEHFSRFLIVTDVLRSSVLHK